MGSIPKEPDVLSEQRLIVCSVIADETEDYLQNESKVLFQLSLNSVICHSNGSRRTGPMKLYLTATKAIEITQAASPDASLSSIFLTFEQKVNQGVVPATPFATKALEAIDPSLCSGPMPIYPSIECYPYLPLHNTCCQSLCNDSQRPTWTLADHIFIPNAEGKSTPFQLAAGRFQPELGALGQVNLQQQQLEQTPRLSEALQDSPITEFPSSYCCQHSRTSQEPKQVFGSGPQSIENKGDEGHWIWCPVAAGLSGEGESSTSSSVPAPSGLHGELRKAFEASVAMWRKDKH
ncbi:hypothetical protein Anapl_17728 [Anas platyrhynchos]|uniref:Uncharacterized protein n=1 Tax=Anas platyrhynchos TaxID=8839 RepID=R0LBJ6_ANAPL|nr:hypothetical protein Anapl_17728 [Anas platyrhynchos]